MSKVSALITAFVGLNGVPHPLVAGDEYDESHPLVQAHPQHFTAPPEIEPPPEGRRLGRPPGSRNKPSTDE